MTFKYYTFIPDGDDDLSRARPGSPPAFFSMLSPVSPRICGNCMPCLTAAVPQASGGVIGEPLLPQKQVRPEEDKDRDLIDGGDTVIMVGELSHLLIRSTVPQDAGLLEDDVRRMFEQLLRAAKKGTSKRPRKGGDIHPLTRCVMDYVKLLADCSGTLDLPPGSSNEGEIQNLQLDISPVSERLLLLLSCLESYLEEESRLYEDPGMQYVFLMNNIWYMVRKVKDSELAKLLGDHWVRKQLGQLHKYALSYLRASWTTALSCLKDEGLYHLSSSNALMDAALKERFMSFNTCFEDMYRIQTAWKVPDTQLQDELRISISVMVIPAYRSFLGRFRSQLVSGRNSKKYIKYTPEDLENYVSDLFVGVPNALHHLRRKSS
ncbi:hypothetical protein SAY86_015449 [Trapa natans]|uniref:Exocyst subunit Exo70 family protein n=1 Tax=Trapa natans TaxID=22666 RepID=A0AAN7L7S1_TRANT|nr:hypothetical protein SAY86_015449 [Trapa natans]